MVKLVVPLVHAVRFTDRPGFPSILNVATFSSVTSFYVQKKPVDGRLVCV
jgi:hypothetical protein